MRTAQLWTWSLCASTTFAFKNTSPFFLFSTSDLFASRSPYLANRQVGDSHQISESLANTLTKCPSDVYILVSQPGVSSDDYRSEDAMAQIQAKLTGRDGSIESRSIIPEVLGQVRVKELETLLVKRCGTSIKDADTSSGFVDSTDSYPHVISIEFPTMPQSGDRKWAQLDENDSYLSAVIKNLNHHSYTVIYTTTPTMSEQAKNKHDTHKYDYVNQDFMPHEMHTDLKREVNHKKIRRQSDGTNSDAPLFEKYNFLNTGIYVGLLFGLLLMSILYVGISAIGNLEVSYAAFSKEMGPTAQRNKQQ